MKSSSWPYIINFSRAHHDPLSDVCLVVGMIWAGFPATVSYSGGLETTSAFVTISCVAMARFSRYTRSGIESGSVELRIWEEGTVAEGEVMGAPDSADEYSAWDPEIWILIRICGFWRKTRWQLTCIEWCNGVWGGSINHGIARSIQRGTGSIIGPIFRSSSPTNKDDCESYYDSNQ